MPTTKRTAVITIETPEQQIVPLEEAHRDALRARAHGDPSAEATLDAIEAELAALKAALAKPAARDADQAAVLSHDAHEQRQRDAEAVRRARQDQLVAITGQWKE